MEARSWKQRLESDNTVWSHMKPSGSLFWPEGPHTSSANALSYSPAQGSPHHLHQRGIFDCIPGFAIQLCLWLMSVPQLPWLFKVWTFLFRDMWWWPFLNTGECTLHAPLPAALSLRAWEINIEENSRAEITPIILKAPVLWTCILGTMEGFLNRFLAYIFLSFIPSCFHPIPYGICQILYSYPQNS